MQHSSWLHRYLKLGGLPKAMLPILEGEGFRVRLEGLSGSTTFRKFRAPGRYHGWKKSGFIGSLAVTELRLVAFGFSSPVINLPLGGDEIRRIQCRVEGAGTLRVDFDAGLFNPEHSGQVELRFNVGGAAAHEVLTWVQSN